MASSLSLVDPVNTHNVPVAAAEWMVDTVLMRANQGVERDKLIHKIAVSRCGLQTLMVGDLHRVCVAIKQNQLDPRGRLILYKAARKAGKIEMIRQCFYSDYPICAVPDQSCMERLTAVRASIAAAAPVAAANAAFGQVSASASASAACRCPALANIAPNNAPMCFRPPWTIPPPPLIYPGPVAFAMMPHHVGPQHPFSAAAAHRSPAADTATAAALQQRSLQQVVVKLKPSAAILQQRSNEPSGKRKYAHTIDSENPFAQARNHARKVAGSSTASSWRKVSYSPTYIKPEGCTGDPASTPQTPGEKNAVAELQQMSFTDPREILSSYRKLHRNNSSPPSVDDLILDIITQREEADEAQKMDEARKLSEQSRKEDAKQRRDELEQELQTSMETGSVGEWLRQNKMFAHSWILRSNAKAALRQLVGHLKTPLKCKLIDLLKLEKKARQWYGDMPRSYFARQLSERLVPFKVADKMLAQIRNEIDTLETVMYDLSEQLGGVPKVFRDAHDAAVAEDNNSDDEDEDAVLLVQSPRPMAPNKTQVSSMNATTSVEVIDLS